MKTSITNKIVAIVGLILLCTNLSAQTDAYEKAMCNDYLRSTYFFEGKVDSTKYFTIKTGEYDYENFTAYFVEVDKVIKGNIQKGTIEIVQYAEGITHNGPDGIRSSKSSEGIGSPPAKGLYLCWDTTGYRMASYFKNSNAKTLRFWNGLSVTDGKIKKATRGHDLSDYFSTLAEFYDYISANYGVKIDSVK